MDPRLKFISLLLALIPALAQAQHIEHPRCFTRKPVPLEEFNQAHTRYREALSADPMQHAEAAAGMALAEYANSIWGSENKVKEAVKYWSGIPGADTVAAMQRAARKAAAAGDCAAALSFNRPALAMLGDIRLGEDDFGLSLLEDQARYLLALNNLQELQPIQDRLIAYWETQGRPMTAFQMPFYARATASLLRKGQLAPAESMAQRVVETARASGEKSALATALLNQAALLFLQSRHLEGDQAYTEFSSLGYPKRVEDVLQELEEQMGSMYRAGKVSLAAERGQAVLAQLETQLTTQSEALQVARAKLGDGNTPVQRGYLSNVRLYGNQVLATERKLARLKLQLAELNHSQKRYAEAERLYLAANTYFDDSGNAVSAPELLMAAQLNASLGEMYRTQSRFDEARVRQRKAYEAYSDMLGAAHPDTQHSREELARIADGNSR